MKSKLLALTLSCCSSLLFGNSEYYTNQDVEFTKGLWRHLTNGLPVTGAITFQEGAEYTSKFRTEKGIITGDLWVYLNDHKGRRDVFENGIKVKSEGYLPNGKLTYAEEFNPAGERMKITYWNAENGRIREELQSKEQVEDSRALSFHNSGYLKNITFSESGELIESIQYFENGLPKERIRKLKDQYEVSTWSVEGTLHKIEFYDHQWNRLSFTEYRTSIVEKEANQS